MKKSRQRILAASAQFTQAATSLLLGMVAVRVLTPADFGRFSIVIATLFLLAGFVTGLVGDSLTVLDRHDPRVRSALQWLALLAAFVGGGIAIGLGTVMSLVPPGAAPMVGIAVTIFLLEDGLRRLLMASQMFGRVLVVDAVYIFVAASVLATLWAGRGISYAGIFAAIAIGQTFAILIAIALLPSDERRISRRLSGDYGAVVGFGGWRAIQSVLGPSRLWAMRVLVAAAAGLAATGVLEANRLLMAPVLLSVQGMGAAILVHYARSDSRSPSQALREADRDAVTLLLVAAAGTLAVVALAPFLAQVILGSTALLDRIAMLGWGLIAVGIGATLPYGTLTAVAGAPQSIVAIRVLDLLLSVLGVAVFLAVANVDSAYRWVPAMVGVFLLSTSLVQRSVCRRQLAVAGEDRPAPGEPAGRRAH